jgi:hypothetical protein
MAMETQQNERMWIAFTQLTIWSVGLITLLLVLLAIALL